MNFLMIDKVLESAITKMYILTNVKLMFVALT